MLLAAGGGLEDVLPATPGEAATTTGPTITTPPGPAADASAPPPSPEGARPDPHLTPGSALAAGSAEICVPGYASSTRSGHPVSAAQRSRIFASYGVQVTLLEALPRVVPVEDEEVSKELARTFSRRGMTIKTGVKVASVKPGGPGAIVDLG